MCMMTKEILLSLLGEGRQRYKYNWQKKKEKKSEKNKYNDNEREDQNVLRKWCPHDLINFKIKCEILVFDFFFSERILLFFFFFGSFLFFFFYSETSLNGVYVKFLVSSVTCAVISSREMQDLRYLYRRDNFSSKAQEKSATTSLYIYIYILQQMAQ